jgi:hypothetical protein
MDNEQFRYICNNQRKWANDFRKKQSIRREIRKIINRKQKGKGGEELKANIINDLKSSLYADEITITENPSGKVFDVRWRGECYSLPALSIEEKM